VLAGGVARSLCNDATAAHVERVAHELGYRVNYHMRSVRTGRSFAIGFTMDTPRPTRAGQIGLWYFDHLREGVESEAQASGMNLLIVRPDSGRSAFQRGVDFLADRRLDALVVPGHFARRDPNAAVVGEGMNIVTVDTSSEMGFPHVGFDPQAGLKLLVEHLQSFGHRRVLWFGRSAPDPSEHREESFLRTAFSAGLTGKVHRASSPLDPTERWDHAIGALERDVTRAVSQLAGDRITAVVAYSDIYAIAAERALLRVGYRVPEDVSLTGFDDSISALGFPPITTVSHELFAVGQAAGRMAIDLVEARSGDVRQRKDDEFQIPPDRMIQPELIIRQSTGPARNAES
jgi:LacI family transcriptional regulator, galactose operon repressor